MFALGDITMQEVLGAMPFQSELVILKMRGYQLRDMFEFSVARFTWSEDLRGEFLHGGGENSTFVFPMLNEEIKRRM